MSGRTVALAVSGAVVLVAAAVGGGWVMVNHQLADAEAKISKAVTFGNSPGKALPAKLLAGEQFLYSQNVPSALVMMGTRYEYGVGVDADLTKALASFKKAADKGDPVGELMLGRLYDGDNTTPDQQHVKMDFIESPDITKSRSDDYLTDNGRRLLTLDDPTALSWYEKAAAQGNTAAMDLIGAYYIKWERTEGNAAKAVQWFTKSAKLGDAAGEYHLGEAYIIEDGVTKDEDAGLSWLQKSAAQGYGGGVGDPALSLGMEYEQGPAGYRDIAQAAKWYKVSADRGNELAARNLGLMYIKGVGVERDYVAAYRLLKLAAAKEAPNAAEALNVLEVQMTPNQLAAAQAGGK